jgi:hypothetical protein
MSNWVTFAGLVLVVGAVGVTVGLMAGVVFGVCAAALLAGLACLKVGHVLAEQGR